MNITPFALLTLVEQKQSIVHDTRFVAASDSMKGSFNQGAHVQDFS